MDTTTAKKQILAAIQLLHTALEELTEITPDFPEEAQELMDKGVCLYCKQEIGDAKSVRGNHERCYRKATREIERGKYTFDDAIAAGRMAPKQSGGPSSDSTVAEEIRAYKAAIAAKHRVSKARKKPS